MQCSDKLTYGNLRHDARNISKDRQRNSTAGRWLISAVCVPDRCWRGLRRRCSVGVFLRVVAVRSVRGHLCGGGGLGGYAQRKLSLNLL